MARFKGWGEKRQAKIEGTQPNRDGRFIIGIDPDRDACGVAIMDKLPGDGSKQTVELRGIPFWELVERLAGLQFNGGIRMVVVEAGYLNAKSNFHDEREVDNALQSANPFAAMQGKKRVGEKIARDVGRNDMVGMLLVRYCQRYNIPHLAIEPTRSKITDPVMFKRMTGLDTLKGQQDLRDAFMLIAGM